MSVITLPWRAPARPWTARRALSLGFSALSTLFLVGFFFLAWPASMGGKATWVTVSGTSMLPDYSTGDMVLAWNDGNWRIGDVVLYSIDGSSTNLIVHRLIAGDATSGWTAQGDNKPAPDPWLIPQAQVQGREILHVPYAGVILTAARTPQVLAIATGVLIFAAVLVMPRRKRKLERIKVDEPCIVDGHPGSVKDLHTEGARIQLEEGAEVGSVAAISVWLNAADGTRRIVTGELTVRYNTVDEGLRWIGGPVRWDGADDAEVVAHHCAAYVMSGR